MREAGALAGRHVIEVGPGPGGLTRALLASDAADVTAVEIDPRAVAAMQELAAQAGPRLHVVAADAWRSTFAALVPAPRQIVANLPYNVASPLLVGWLRQASAFERLTLMFQQEVAERICAAPDTPLRPTVGAGAMVCDVRIALRMPPEAFTPPPKVWSAVVSCSFRSEQPGPTCSRGWSG